MRFAFESAAFLCDLRSGNLLKLSLHVGELELGLGLDLGARGRDKWQTWPLCVVDLQLEFIEFTVDFAVRIRGLLHFSALLLLHFKSI